MAITTLDQYIASAKQRLEVVRTSTRTSLASIPFTMFDIPGQPGAGTLPGTSQVVPVLQTPTLGGYPIIPSAFSSGNCYLSRVEFNNSVLSRLAIFDVLSKSGAYAYNATTAVTVSSVLDIKSRCPDYDSVSFWGGGNEIWIEIATAITSVTAWTVSVGYTNQSGTTGRSTGASSSLVAANLILGRMLQLPLQAGDTGVQAINSVITTFTTTGAGTFNVLIMRPLWTSGRVNIANGGDIHDMLRTGLPRIYQTSALMAQVCADGVSTGLPEINLEVCNG